MGWQQMWTDLRFLKIRIFFQKTLDRPNQLERAREISFCTRRFSTKVLWRKADQLTSLAENGRCGPSGAWIGHAGGSPFATGSESMVSERLWNAVHGAKKGNIRPNVSQFTEPEA
jgi:hypothetical protein